MPRLSSVLFLSLLALALVQSPPALALDPINNSLFSDVAIHGYDPVAYFTQGKPVAGRSDINHTWKGAIWYFSTPENRDLFKANPTQYAPQYGGYCAWAVSQNYTADIDPKAWTIVNGKLYLNYDAEVQAKWSASRAANIAAADKNWPALLAK